MKVIKIKGISHIKSSKYGTKYSYCEEENIEGYIETTQTSESVMCVECEAIYYEEQNKIVPNIYNQNLYKGFEIKRMFPNKYSIRKNNKALGSNYYYSYKACQNVIDTLLRSQAEKDR